MKERLFLLKKQPVEALRWKSSALRYGWLPGGGRELVLREQDDRRTLSVALADQPEVFQDIRLEKGDFEALWPETGNQRLRFVRRQGKIGRWALTIDSFQDNLAGLDLVRVSVPPQEIGRPTLGWDWLGVEVSYDSRFTWTALASGRVTADLAFELAENRFTGAVGAVPYIRSSDGLKIVLVTTQRKDRWIFPKGQLKNGLTHKDIALMEAAEEAGLIGEISGDPILCSYSKTLGAVDLILYPMEVKSMLKLWQENEIRERAQFSFDELLTRPDSEGLLPGLRMIESMDVARS